MRRLVNAVLVVALTTAGILAAPASARADLPLPPLTDFTAPLCPGTTYSDPAVATGPVSDLTRVFGPRLVDFNAGEVIVLYANFGDNDNGNIVPPTCGTRYVSGVGAVSEWMYCTDLFSHTCSGTNAAGELVDPDGVPIPGMAALPGANPKLSADQEKLIAYLIRTGHPFDGPAGLFGNVTTADPDADPNQRMALQGLIWCISDPPGPSWPDLQTACDNSMDATEQARLLALIPDVPVVDIDLTGPGTTLDIGDVATITLHTNLYNQPIQLGVTGVAGTLSVISGPGTLGAGEITVSGIDPSLTASVVLGYRASVAGQVDIEASARPVSVSHIGWDQSPGVAQDGKPCQVYATFHTAEIATVSDLASARFAQPSVQPAVTTPVAPAVSRPTTGGTVNRLATSGSSPAPTAMLGVVLLLAGAVLLGGSWIARTRHARRAAA